MKLCGHLHKRDINSTFCHSCYMRKWRDKNREKVKEYYKRSYARRNQEDPVREKLRRKAAALWTDYRISLEEYQNLLTRFNNCCAICGNSKQLCVDHDHLSGKIRGIICKRCNTAIGRLGDNEEGLTRALDYLKGMR